MGRFVFGGTPIRIVDPWSVVLAYLDFFTWIRGGRGEKTERCGGGDTDTGRYTRYGEIPGDSPEIRADTGRYGQMREDTGRYTRGIHVREYGEIRGR